MVKIIAIILICFPFQLSAQYCIPTYNPDPSSYVHNFSLGDILNRNSEVDIEAAYTFHENITTSLEMGRTYPITASGPSTAGVIGDWAVWIDFNNDTVFSPDERIISEIDTRWISSMVEIPNDPSFLGERRMRISYVWTSQELDPCGDYSNGETEDYTVTIVDTPIATDYYCIPFDAFNLDEFIIDTFSFGGIVNLSSGSNDYNFSDYLGTEFTGDFILGDTVGYSISTDIFSGISGGFIGWIDYNDNQIYENSEIIFEDGPDIYFAQGSIIIPEDASFLGKKRMRIRAVRSSNFSLDPCLFDNGTETEEYFVNIITEPVVIATDDLEEAIDVNIFPNPASDILNVNNRSNGQFDFTIYNFLGQVEKIGQINQQDIQPINVSRLNPGIYILKIKKDHKTKTIKFLKH